MPQSNFKRLLRWANTYISEAIVLDTQPQRSKISKIMIGKVHRLAVPMILAPLPDQSQSLTYLRRRIAEKPCCFTIVTHNDVQKSGPGDVYLRIRAKLVYTRLLLGRIGIALKRNIQVMHVITEDKEQTYAQMECRHTEPSKL